jgi:pyrroloquinoline-quinone synthase
MDEEGRTNRSAPHPQLWNDFIAAFGTHRSNISYGENALKIKEVFLNLCRSSYAEGMCALYAYEYQTPEISKTKIEGLQKFYGISNPSYIEFFKVHEIADVHHSKTCAALMDALPAEDQAKGLNAAKYAATSLWDFLSEAYGKHTTC